MNTLSKILKQDLVVAEEDAKLRHLQNQYVEENKKYSKGDYVFFKKEYMGDMLFRGVVTIIRFDDAYEGLIRYGILAVKKNLEPSMSDRSYYYVSHKNMRDLTDEN